jgi:hypothetical protein
MTRTAAATAWYAYAVVGPVDESVREAATGLEVVGTDEVAVVAVEVPLSEYGEDVLPSRLNDEAWLERTARAHEDVVERLAAATTVLPLRFGSLHRDRAAVESFVAEKHDELAATLDRVRGCVEIGVKVWLATPPAAEAPEHRQAASGRDYLERRRLARARAAEASASLDERLLGLHEGLLAVAEAGVLNRPQPPELSARDGPERRLPRPQGRRLPRSRVRGAPRRQSGSRPRAHRTVGSLQLRRGEHVVSVAETPRSLREQVTLVDLVDRVLNAGVVLTGDLTLAVADVDLVYVGLRVLLASASTLERP